MVSAMDKASLSTINVASASMPKQDPIIKNCAGSPSRNIAINKLRYTSAKPSSCCKIESAAGVSAITPAINCDFKLVKSTSCREINFAMASDVNILQSSAGCKLRPPASGIHDLDPLIFLPNTNVASMSRMPST